MKRFKDYGLKVLGIFLVGLLGGITGSLLVPELKSFKLPNSQTLQLLNSLTPKLLNSLTLQLPNS